MNPAPATLPPDAPGLRPPARRPRAVFGPVRRWSVAALLLATYALSAGAILHRRAAVELPGTCTIHIGHLQLESGVREGLDTMAADYHRLHPEVFVVQDAIPESTYGQWVTCQLLGRRAPDILEVGVGLTANLWKNYYGRYFLPTTALVGRPNPYNAGTPLAGMSLRATFRDGMKGSYNEDLQEYVSIPLSQTAVRVFYNRGLLRQLTGLDKPPADYRGFLECCARIRAQTDAQGQPYTPIASSRYHYAYWESALFDPITYRSLYRSDGNRDAKTGKEELFAAFHSGRLDMHHPAVAAKFTMAREVSQYFQPGFTGLTRDDALMLFARGGAVFMTTGTWEIGSLLEQAKGKLEIGVADFPETRPDDPEFGAMVAGPRYESAGSFGLAFSVTRTSAHPEVAQDFLLYCASQKANEKLNKIMNWPPAIRGTEASETLQGFDPHLEGVYGAFTSANLAIGGETLIRWQQLYALFQTGQITYDELVRQFEPFYLRTGELDFEDQQREWRRGLKAREATLADLRAKALLAPAGPAAQAAWVKYRYLLSKQITAEDSRADVVRTVHAGPAAAPAAPYSYRPEALEAVRRALGPDAPPGPAAPSPAAPVHE